MDDAADEFVYFLSGLFQKYPEMIGRDLFLAGESYGGKYLPRYSYALLKANEAPLSEIRPMVVNIPINTSGENEKISPDFTTPILNPSNSAKPMRKPTMVNIKACVNINLLMYLLPAPIAFKVP